MLFTISLIKIREGSGPRVEPCGTPAKIEAQSDFVPFITALCLRPDRITSKPTKKILRATNSCQFEQ